MKNKAIKKLMNPAFALVALSALSFQALGQTWGVAIEQNPMLTNCGGTKDIPVAGATDCPTAKAAAWNLLATLLNTPNCMGSPCPKGSITNQVVPYCKEESYTRPNGSLAKRWQINFSWTCTRPTKGLSLPCCKSPYDVVTLDLSTGQGSGPKDSWWKMNGGPAYITPKVGSWLDLPSARWIQTVASPAPSNKIPSGVFNYKVNFNNPICPIPSEVRLEGKFAADNSAKLWFDRFTLLPEIALCPGPTCFMAPGVNFSVFSIFPGNHELESAVTNLGSYSGFLVNAQLTRQCKK
jgi:hypothetical protein